MAFRLDQVPAGDRAEALRSAIEETQRLRQRSNNSFRTAGVTMRESKAFANPEAMEPLLGLGGQFGKMAFAPGVKEFADRYWGGRYSDVALAEESKPADQEVA